MPVSAAILRSGVYQLKYMDSVPDSAACNEAVKLTVKRGFGGLKGFVNGVMRTIARNMDQIRYPDAEKEPGRYLSVKYSIPEWLVQRFTEQYGAEACERSLAAYLMPHPSSVQDVYKRQDKSKGLIKCLIGLLLNDYVFIV